LAGLDGADACRIAFVFVAARSYANFTLFGVAAVFADVLLVESVRETLSVLPDFDIAVPATICPAPENCVN